jgi:hypothetical protein
LDDDNGEDSGSAYVFTRSDTIWIQQAKLTASDGAKSDYFSRSISLISDTALIGARGNDEKGSAYVFVRSGNTWLEQAKLTASDGASGDGFGYSVSLSDDTALIGAHGDDDNGYASGSAYVFTRSDNIWLEQAKLTASDGKSGDVFGSSVSIDDGDTAIIGALYQSDAEPYFGAAYVFAKNKHSPDKPTITGQVNGKPNIEHEYKFVSTDPDDDAIEYCIDWGDNSSEVSIGPYPSGAEASAKHAWSEEGTYIIKAKARDVYGDESDWATLTVSMSKSKVNNKFLNTAIFERTSYATIDDDDDEPPYTHLYYDTATGEVTLIAVDYPIGGPWSGVKATYYKIDSGDFEVYTAPFILPEGTHTVYFYSEDIMGNKETTRSKTLSLDTTPPTVHITLPEEGGRVYLFGNPIMDRPLSDTTLCIGKVPIEATADDNGGTGVNKVLFSCNGETGWDDTEPYTDVFTGRVFGDLTISVTAIDNLGHESDPVEITIKCYCLG